MTALELLLHAHSIAERTGGDPWQFSVTWRELAIRHFTQNDMRYMLIAGLLLHRLEVTRGDSLVREFIEGRAGLGTGSCFLLTPAGVPWSIKRRKARWPILVDDPGDAEAREAFRPRVRNRPPGLFSGSAQYGLRTYPARQHRPRPPRPEIVLPPRSESWRGPAAAAGGAGVVPAKPDGNVPSGPASPQGKLVIRPFWDMERRELKVGEWLVKCFRVPALNQTTILAAFEEDQWPPRIDDPIPPRYDQDPKRRLHDTINSLNRNQQHPMLRFLGDGSGHGVLWELVRSATQVNVNWSPG